MKKLIFLLLAVLMLTACRQDTPKGQEAVYVNITADALAELGYPNIKEFGGIIGWPYETE